MNEVKMTVNVSLCGSVPRSQMTRRRPHPKNILETNTSLPFRSSSNECRGGYTTSPIISSLARQPRRVSNDCLSALPSQIAPPNWAVPARGEAKLEPVDGAVYGLTPVDLTTKSCFRFGRSQSSDIQLLHETSSRRHAIIFHHPNGSCYVIDCGSAHGTYINGNRVNTPVVNKDPTKGNSHNYGVIPCRVKKGSLIRFGGVGAPTFTLKSFSVHLSDLVNHLEISKSFACATNVIEDEPKQPTSLCTFGLNDPSKDAVNDSLLAVNTRLNAMGRTSMKYALRHCLPALTRARLSPQPALAGLTSSLKKRSFSSLVPRSVSIDDHMPKNNALLPRRISTEDHIPKKMRTVSLEKDDGVRPGFGHISDVALISPSRTTPNFTMDFNDGDLRLVSPNPSIDNDTLDLNIAVKSILMVPTSLSLTRKLKKKVKFTLPIAENSSMTSSLPIGLKTLYHGNGHQNT